MRNVPDIVVLMHVLGDKHSPPAPLERIWSECRMSADWDGDFVRKATFGTPADFTDPARAEQQALLGRLAAAVAAAYRSGRLGFLISIKSPYAWAVSLARYERWDDRPPEGSGRACLPRLLNACRRFNDNYSAWLDLHDAVPGVASIVRYEELIADPLAVFQWLGQRHGWPPAECPLTLPDRRVAPAIWDDHAPAEGRLPVRGCWPVSVNPASLPDEFRNLISETIDWELMRQFGYECWRDRASAHFRSEASHHQEGG